MGLEGLNQDIESLSSNQSAQSQQTAGALKESRDLLFKEIKDFVERQFFPFCRHPQQKKS